MRLSEVCLAGTHSTRCKRDRVRKVLYVKKHPSLFFDRTYEIQLNGGTPFDTGVALDPSVSLKGNESFCVISLTELTY